MKILPVIVPLGLFILTSCDSPKESDTVSEKSPPPPEHPWDWIPEDPALASGREIYLMECSGCHDEGEEGAPALTKKSEWDTRSEQGLAVLLDHALNGFQGPDGKMPARGGTPSLTDEEVTNAVNYMLAAPK
ncbi:c-type cytochrome [Roseibacillus persicicus]|uniref:c-type cytochrome n=1 Tax=Roseibacillus persicicus TaxID=454148 RepID=UPI00280D78BD|nr:c-type cytochrome [Roseibacillus persicicus]MDQ8192022.1 c-type cytochrome [Roseibacillus persicicus]